MTTQRPHYDADTKMAVPAPHSKQFLHLFLAKGIVSYGQIISSRLPSPRLSKRTCSLPGRALLNTGV